MPLDECVELCKFIESKGLDGVTAADIAGSLGYKNIKTNTFSAKLSAARQFGLLSLKEEGYWLTPLAKSILHPIDPADIGRLYRQALLTPPIYDELIHRLDGKRVPELEILANILYHHHNITVSAKDAAAEAFVSSARFAGALGEDHVLNLGVQKGASALAVPHSESASEQPRLFESPPAATSGPAPPRERSSAAADHPSAVRIDLRLWGGDEGKIIRVRGPESLTPESFERLLQALKLHFKIEPPQD